ncbi:hypothetical protein KC349_g1264 [Hortaea werneckii]|nr:hypothetical protein KC349_g1264 [Hortaea werneckii]
MPEAHFFLNAGWAPINRGVHFCVSLNNNNNNNNNSDNSNTHLAGMNRDIIDQVAAAEMAEAGVAPEEAPTRYKGPQYFLDASANLLDAALKKEKAYNRVPVTSALKIAVHIAAVRKAQVVLLEGALQNITTEALKHEKMRRADVLKLLGDALESYPAISTEQVGEHKIQELMDIPEPGLIAMIKGYLVDAQKSKQSFEESTIPGENTNTNIGGNAAETDEARAYLQRTEAAEQERRGGNPEYFKDLREGNAQFEEDAYAGQGYGKGAPSSFQQFSRTTPSGSAEADFENAMGDFVKVVGAMKIPRD